jgi:hypothetical protein
MPGENNRFGELIINNQHIFGGQGSNYTKKQVLEESVLVELYWSCHRNIETNFGLTTLTSQHAPLNLAKTVEKMRSYFERNWPNDYQPGRETEMPIKDMLTHGQQLLYGNTTGAVVTDGLDEAHTFVLEGEDFGI